MTRSLRRSESGFAILRGAWCALADPLLGISPTHLVLLDPPLDTRAGLGRSIVHAGGKKTVHVNQRKAPPLDRAFVSLGVYRFAQGKAGYVEIGNRGVDGYVVIDAVQWLPVKE